MTPGRRTLAYKNLDDIMPDVDRLLGGHTTVGNWSLAQICRHLATVMRRTVDLPASTPVDESRRVGEEQKKQFFETGVVPEGIQTSPQLMPSESLNEREEVERLRQAIAHYKGSPGPVIPHILLGFLTRDEWDRFHCIHAAHHFSFAIPRAGSA
jgi:Protein of unknown function (DUF1569)